MAIKHVFFDLDHTLWDFEANSRQAFAACFKKHRIQIDFDTFMAYYTPINQAYWKRYREEKVTKEKLKIGRLRDTFELINYAASEELIAYIADDYLAFLPQFNELFEGTIEILEYLNKKYHLHIITNGFEEIQTHKMNASGLDKYFIELITSEHVGVKKPNPKVFYYALDRTQATPEESIMIGDNLEADVLGAMAIGIDAIHFNPDKQSLNAEVKTISKLMELKDFL